MRQTSHHYQEQSHTHKEQEDIELEKFAYDIAETLVSSLEKSAGIQTKVGHVANKVRYKFVKQKTQ